MYGAYDVVVTVVWLHVVCVTIWETVVVVTVFDVACEGYCEGAPLLVLESVVLASGGTASGVTSSNVKKRRYHEGMTDS